MPFREARLWIKQVELAGATRHVEENDAFRFARKMRFAFIGAQQIRECHHADAIRRACQELSATGHVLFTRNEFVAVQ